MKEQLIERKFPIERIMKIPNGININIYKEIVKIPHNRIHYGYVGRLTKFKNITFLINGFKEYFKKFPEDRLYIYGEGSEEKGLQNLIQKYNLSENIILKGYMKNKKKIYSNIDVLVDPALAQGISNAHLEAMVTGTFIIVSNVHGSKELVRNWKTGLLFDVHDKKDLMDKLIFYKTNEKIVNQIIMEAKKEVYNFYNIDAITKKIYDRIVNYLNKTQKSQKICSSNKQLIKYGN